MTWIFRRFPVMLVLATAGCGAVFDFDEVRKIDTREIEFNAALAREYKALALFELDDMGDPLSARRFRDKALASAQGRTTAPEELDDWTLPWKERPALAAARVRLLAALSKGAHFMPEVAARAQASFDCWIEQQEENFQADDIQKCRDGFYAAVTLVERGLAAAQSFTPVAAVIAVATKPEPEPASVTSAYTLLFGFDEFALGGEHAAVLDAIAGAARQGRSVRLVVSGHADRAGPEPYNQTLSQKRAETIRRALIERGLAPDRLAVAAYGEKRPRVASPDGMREPRNRRVEIVFGPAPSL